MLTKLTASSNSLAHSRLRPALSPGALLTCSSFSISRRARKNMCRKRSLYALSLSLIFVFRSPLFRFVFLPRSFRFPPNRSFTFRASGRVRVHDSRASERTCSRATNRLNRISQLSISHPLSSTPTFPTPLHPPHSQIWFGLLTPSPSASPRPLNPTRWISFRNSCKNNHIESWNLIKLRYALYPPHRLSLFAPSLCFDSGAEFGLRREA